MTGRVFCLLAAIVLAVSAVSPAKGKDRPPQRITSKTLDALARQYLDSGLPMPPPGAPPMLIQSSVIGSLNRKNVTTYVVGFQTAPAQEDNPSAPFLMGTQRGEAYRTDAAFPVARPLGADGGLPASFVADEHWESTMGIFPVNNWLALAVQCHLHGDDRVAEQIFARGLASDLPGLPRLTSIGDGGPRDCLAATAWNYWMNTLCTEGTDRREILAHLEKLSATFPALAGPFQRDYLASLRLAMIPGQGAPGSVENLIDALVDHTGSGGTSRSDTGDPGFCRLQTLGFEAVPALIAHLGDRRLSRSVVRVDGVIGVAPQQPRRINELVSDLLEDIAGPETFLHGTAVHPPERPADKAAAERWWTQASAMGEEAYLTVHVFPPNEVSLQIVAERYPQHLGEMYARILRERPEVDCQGILMTITGCGHLAREERLGLLREGAGSSNVKCSFEAIGALCEFDRAAAGAELIAKLDHWPTDLTKPYSSQPPQMFVTNDVLYLDSAEVWQAYERALFRASPAFRMEMLKWLAEGSSNGAPQDVRRLAVLDLFLDDEDVRVIRKEDEAEGGRFWNYSLTDETRRISVRNFVAGLLANLLDVKPPPGAAHTERWWAKYRLDARAAIDRQARAAAEAPAAGRL